MKLAFDHLAQSVLQNFRGGEGALIARMHVDENNKIMHSRLEAGSSVGRHTHDTSSEIIYILSGTGKVLYDDTVETLTAGDCHYCPKGHSHSLINSGDGALTFFAVVPEHGA